MVTKGERGGDKLGVWDEHIQTTIHKIHNQEGSTVYNTENYTQYCVITYKAKESEKEYIFMYN